MAPAIERPGETKPLARIGPERPSARDVDEEELLQMQAEFQRQTAEEGGAAARTVRVGHAARPPERAAAAKKPSLFAQQMRLRNDQQGSAGRLEGVLAATLVERGAGASAERPAAPQPRPPQASPRGFPRAEKRQSAVAQPPDGGIPSDAVLEGMSAAEIAQVQAELRERLSPAALAGLGKLAARRARSNAQACDKNANEESCEPSKGQTCKGKTESRERSKAQNSEDEKLAWTRPAEPTRQPTDVTLGQVRFALDGRALALAESAALPTHLGLHHHGDDADLAGYTLGELLHLSQSSVTGQRTVALRALAGVLERAHSGSGPAILGLFSEVDGFALVAAALGDRSATVRARAAEALYCALGLTPVAFEAMVVALRRPLLGRDGPQTLHVPLAPYFTERMAGAQTMDARFHAAQQARDATSVEEFARADVIYGLCVLSSLPELLVRLLRDTLEPSTVSITLEMLTVLALHDAALVFSVPTCSALLHEVLQPRLLEADIVAVARIVRVLVQRSDHATAAAVVNSKAPGILTAAANGSAEALCEVALLWRCLVAHGCDIDGDAAVRMGNAAVAVPSLDCWAAGLWLLRDLHMSSEQLRGFPRVFPAVSDSSSLAERATWLIGCSAVEPVAGKPVFSRVVREALEAINGARVQPDTVPGLVRVSRHAIAEDGRVSPLDAVTCFCSVIAAAGTESFGESLAKELLAMRFAPEHPLGSHWSRWYVLYPLGVRHFTALLGQKTTLASFATLVGDQGVVGHEALIRRLFEAQVNEPSDVAVRWFASRWLPRVDAAITPKHERRLGTLDLGVCAPDGALLPLVGLPTSGRGASWVAQWLAAPLAGDSAASVEIFKPLLRWTAQALAASWQERPARPDEGLVAVWLLKAVSATSGPQSWVSQSAAEVVELARAAVPATVALCGAPGALEPVLASAYAAFVGVADELAGSLELQAAFAWLVAPFVLVPKAPVLDSFREYLWSRFDAWVPAEPQLQAVTLPALGSGESAALGERLRTRGCESRAAVLEAMLRTLSCPRVRALYSSRDVVAARAFANGGSGPNPDPNPTLPLFAWLALVHLAAFAAGYRAGDAGPPMTEPWQDALNRELNDFFAAA